MAEILRGAPAAEALCEALSPRVRVLRDRGTAPTLAIVRVGARPDGVAYESSILNRCAKVGIEVQRCVLPEDCVRARLPEEIRRIKENPLVHGCLMIRPLGNLALEQEARALLAPEKDVDGMTPLSLAAVFIGNGPGYPPCTAHACLEILDDYRIPLRGRRAVVIGRSLAAGHATSSAGRHRGYLPLRNRGTGGHLPGGRHPRRCGRAGRNGELLLSLAGPGDYRCRRQPGWKRETAGQCAL